MKTGVYSLLFALNLLYESGSLPAVNALLGGSVGSVPSPDLPEVPEVPTVDSVPQLPSLCLINSLTSSSELLLRTGMLVCQHDQGMGRKLNDDNFEALYKAFKETLKNTLCAVDDVLQTTDTLQKLATPTSDLVKILVELLRPILDESGLSQPLMGTLCGLLEPALTLDCLPALLANDLVKLITDMKLQACQGQNEHLFYEDLMSILKRLGCLMKSSSELPALPPVIELDAEEPVSLPVAPLPVAGSDIKKPIALPAVPKFLIAKQSLTILMKILLKSCIVPDQAVPLPVSGPAVKEPNYLPVVPPPIAGPDVFEPIAPVKAVPPTPDTTTATVPTPALTPDTTTATVPTPTLTPDTTTSAVPIPDLSIVKRDLGEGISTPELDVIKQGGPKDPVVMVSCIAIDLLVKKIAPV